MPEENAETTEGAEPELSEYPISDQEILNVLGLDENLQPRGAEEGKVEEKAKPEPGKEEEEPVSASGENADEDEEVEGAPEAGQEDQKEEEEPEEQEEVAAEEKEKPPKGSMQHRINQLTQRNKDLIASKQQLEERLEKAAPMVLQPTRNDPLSHLTSEKEVNDELDQYREMKAWCWKNLNGGELTDSNGRSREVSGEEVRSRLSFAEDMLNQFGPERKTFLREQTAYEAVARNAYPELFDSTSRESKICAQFLQRLPELMRVANYQLILGDAIRGMSARLAEQSGRSGSKAAVSGNGLKGPTGKLAPKLAPRPIKAGAVAPQKATQQSAHRQRLEREFMGSGDKRALEAFILSTL